MTSDDSLHRRIESAQDVAGWKSIIFLPFHLIWQFVIMFSILYVFTMTTNMITYHLDNAELIYFGYFCDCLYLVDVFCSILHHTLKGTRKLKNYKSRPWILILIDCMSLIPLELIYVSVYMSSRPHSKVTRNYMFLNRNLRIYRFYFYFSQTNSQTQSFKYAFAITFIELLIYGFCMTHTAACVFEKLKTDDELNTCPEGRFDCMMLNEVNVFFLLCGRFIGDNKSYNTTAKRLACSISLTVSYFYMFAVMAPLFIFSCMKRHKMFFEFWNRYKRLRIFVNNMIEDETLKRKTLDEFRTVWTFGKGDIEPELLKTFPLNLRKNAYSDVYWDAFRHSELFHNLSYSCKRSLALKIVGDFYMPDTFFWDIGENKNSMLYLSSGILQIMSEENSKSPIMSFSGGTILGESTIFFPARSKAILRVATYSEIHVLHAKDFFRVIKDYPRDREIISSKLKLRLEIAKMTRIRKTEISKVIFNRNMGEVGDFVVDEDDSVKWIKTQFRNIAIMQEAYTKSVKEQAEPKTITHASKRMEELRTGIDHTSIYLPLLNLGEEIEVLTDLTCLKTSLPWVIDPNSHFMRLWRRIILLLVFFCSVVYPVFLAWWKVLPVWLINISQFITMVNLVDIFMQLSTAIKTKDRLIVQSGAIFRYRLKRLSFYADFISALPLQNIFRHFWTAGITEEPYLKLIIALSLLKVYNVSVFLNEWCETLTGRFSLRVMVKYLFFYCLVVYWSAALLHFMDVECMLHTCTGAGWYKPELEAYYPQYRQLAAVFFALNYLMDIPNVLMHTHYFPSALVIWLTVLVMLFTVTGWFGDFNAAYMLETTQEVKFRSLLQSVINFMNDRNIIGRIKKRVLDTMYFQWYYDYGDYLTQQRAMLEDAPTKLKRDVNKATIFKIMKTCEIFRTENEALIWYLCRKCSRLALPANSIVLTYGIQTMDLYIVYKGYLQLNSFLPKDILDGFATPILYGPGRILPLVIALNQMPSGVTARTITDCELIVISLEDFLAGLILNNCFKDYVEAIKDVDLEPFRNSKLTISRVTNVFGVAPESRSAPFAKLKCCGWILRMFLMKKFINSENTSFIRWELFRLFCYVVAAVSWPIIFSAELSKIRIGVIYFLLAIDSFGWFDFYIKLHIGFYNKKGIFITHTLSTSWHYITTSFILDLINFIPYLHSIYIIVTDPDFEVNDFIAIFHSCIRLLTLIRLFLFITNYEEIGSIVFYIKFFGYILLMLILLNCFIVLKVRSEITRTSDPDRPYEITQNGWIRVVDVPTGNDPAKMYLIVLYCVIMMISRCYPFFKDFTGEILVYEIIFALIGMFFVYIGNAFFITRETGAKMNFTIYQYHMKSLTHFLKEERAEDSISKEAISHFEHEWERKRGDDLHKVFSRFPNILEEDLMYPIYRKTMRGVPCFSNANEGFFRTLSRLFVEVHFKKGSTIMFPKGVHKDIYFIHNGECYVAESDIILKRGSMMGDIKGMGIMTNHILAQTHAILLMIKSPEFFVLLSNFYNTEVAFFEAIENVEDFIETGYTFPDPKHPTVADDLVEPKSTEKNVECTFELAEQKQVSNVLPAKKPKGKLKILFKIYPHSLISKILKVIFIIDAILTAILIPLIIGLRLAITSVLAFMYSLDAIWIIKIVTTLRTSFIDPDTGNLVTNAKEIFTNYVKTSDGFIVDVLSVFPFEFVHDLIKYMFNDWEDSLRKYCYSLRLLRLLSLWIRVEKEKRKISLRDRTRWFIIIMRQTIAYNFLMAINLLIATDQEMVLEESQTEITKHLKDALLWGYLSMFNVYSGVGFYIFPPKNMIQIAFQICIAVYSMIERTLLTSEILSIISVSLYVKSEKLFKLQLMERYLTVRDISPALRKKLMNYATDLFAHFKAEVDPWFLKTAPYYIKVQIMQDLYMQYFLDCYAFRGLPQDFLKQLAARLERHIYFPGDVIAEKGDVDRNMFFVHRGEVATIEKDPVYQGLDYEMDFYAIGDYFGLEQGMNRSVPHKATFRAITRVDLLSLNFSHWEDLRRAFPEVIESIHKKIQNSKTKEQTGEKFQITST